jgi:H+/Cl- antiporter ClcA
LRRRLQDVSWFDIAAAIGMTGVFDLVIGLIVSGYFGAHCRNICTLHQQAHEDRMLLLLIPLLLGLPPVLVALLLKRLRVLLAAVQAVICAALMIHAALDLRTVNSRINGTAPCWNSLYSAKDCPWGPV